MTTRYITDARITAAEAVEGIRQTIAAMPKMADLLNPTPPEGQREDPERYRLYRLCPCDAEGCVGGKIDGVRCKKCRGEGKTLDLVATATDPESVGAALVQLCLEDEFSECPFGLMDRPQGQKGRWLLKPWLPSARNVSDAGRTLRSARKQ